MTADEVYRAILNARLYTFKADQPQHVVRSQIRRHCVGLEFSSASEVKFFELRPDGKYFYLESPTKQARRDPRHSRHSTAQPKDSATEVRAVYERYIGGFKHRALGAINKLKAREFEHFCRNLLDAYGFRDVKVTRVGQDGGIP